MLAVWQLQLVACMQMRQLQPCCGLKVYPRSPLRNTWLRTTVCPHPQGKTGEVTFTWGNARDL